MWRRLGPWLVLLFWAASVGAGPVSVDVVLAPGGPEVDSIVLHGTAGDSLVERDASVAHGRARAILRLADDIAWSVAAEAPGYWSPPTLLIPAREGAPTALRLVLWPIGVLAGRLAVAHGEEAPDVGLEVQFEPADEPRQGDAEVAGDLGPPPAGRRPCTVADGRFRCEVPAGTWDLRLRAPGYAAWYRWGAEVAPGTTDEAGTFTLVKGGSVVGWVTADGTGPDDGSCEVSLTPYEPTIAPEGQGHRRSALQRQRTRPDSRGFFQVRGVSPGSYVVTARAPGRVPAKAFPVTVKAGEERMLRDPLLLQPPLTLSVELEPPADPWNAPWLVGLVAWEGENAVEDLVARGEPAEGGLWQSAPLPPGRYLLMVQRAGSSVWASREVELTPTSTLLRLEIPVVPVEGTVTLKDEPVAADLRFERGDDDEEDPVSVPMESGPEGGFTGYLPAEGEWDVRVEARDPELSCTLREVEVRRRQGDDAARVDLELPEQELAGIVVDTEGRGVASAAVRLTRGDAPEQPRTATSDGDGEFAFEAVPAGRYVVVASAKERQSKERLVELGEGDRPRLRLVLEERPHLEGRVVGGLGGIAGASVMRFSPAGGSQTPQVTDLDGSFSFELPPGDGPLVLVAMPPGFCFAMERYPSPPSDPVTVRVRQDGGTLVVYGPPRSESVARGLVPTLVSETGAAPLDVTLYWSGLNGQSGWNVAKGARIPAMAPGTYSLCTFTFQEWMAAIGAGVRANPAACRSGYLPPGGELELSAPER